MLAPLLHVRVGRVTHSDTTHPLIAAFYVGDAQVTQLVHHRDMRHVRAHCNGFIAGLTATGLIRYHDTVLTLPHLGRWPYRNVDCRVPINPDYVLADGIDPMQD